MIWRLTSTIEFVEKPASEDEKHIAEVIHKLFDALRKKDEDAQKMLYWPDALIELWHSKKKLPAEQYLNLKESKEERKKLIAVKFNEVQIRIVEKDRAIVSTVVIFDYTDFTSGPYRKVWKLRKTNDQWRIEDSSYGEPPVRTFK